MDMHFGKECLLLLYNPLCDMLGQQLNLRPGGGINTIHHLVQCITEARHMYSRLRCVEIGIEVKGCVEPLLVPLIPDQDRLCDANDTRKSKAYMHSRLTALNIAIK